MIIINPDKIKAAANAIANARGGQRGAPPVKNVLDMLPKKIADEVMEAAEAALHAVGDHLTIYALEVQKREMVAALEWALTCVPYPSDCHTAIGAVLTMAKGGV